MCRFWYPVRPSKDFSGAPLLLLLICAVVNGVSGRAVARVRCSAPVAIPNGSFNLKRNAMLMRVNCRQGFTMIGPRVIDCVNGKWFGEKPVCARKGCPKKLASPENGQIHIENDYKAVLFCSDNYNLAGNRFTYCNGTHWDRQLGNCRERKNAVQHECDFESDDICGWVYEPTESYEWKRVSAANVFGSFQTGPRHDHTVPHTESGGHYMLMESLGGRSSSTEPQPISLMSPIYNRMLSLRTSCCFRFYYFMYGAGVGTLSVYVRPVSITLDQILADKALYMKYTKSGSQNNIWNEAQFDIEEMAEDFQIVFIAIGGRNHLSDIAIDDVKLLTGRYCKAKNDSDISHEVHEIDTTEVAVYDTQSCVLRCAEASGVGYVNRDGKLFGLCNCHPECEENGSCCPDYRLVCLDETATDLYKTIDEGTTEYVVRDPTSWWEPTTTVFTTSTSATSTKASIPKPIDVSYTRKRSTETTRPTTTQPATLTPVTSTTKSTSAATTAANPRTSTNTPPTTSTSTTPTSTTKATSTITPRTTSTTNHRVTSTSASPTQPPVSKNSSTNSPPTQSVESAHNPTTTTTTTPTSTATNPQTTAVKSGSKMDNRTKQQPKTWLVNHWLIAVPKTPQLSARQKQHGAAVLKGLFVFVTIAMLLSTAWYRLCGQLPAALFGSRESSSADAVGPKPLGGIPAARKLLPRCVTQNATGSASGRRKKPRTSGRTLLGKHCVGSDDLTLLWTSNADDSDDDEVSGDIALHKKNTTNL